MNILLSSRHSSGCRCVMLRQAAASCAAKCTDGHMLLLASPSSAAHVPAASMDLLTRLLLVLGHFEASVKLTFCI